MGEGIRFPCEAPLGHVLLGFYDGIESWTVQIGIERSRREQLLVSAHERLHHELQTTTPWGLVLMAVLNGPAARSQPSALARHLALGCRNTHEAFTTFFSVGDDPDDLALLDGNHDYERHYWRAHGLADPQAGWTARSRIADALLRAAMSPSEILTVPPESVTSLRLSEIGDNMLPDNRLRRVEDFLRERGPAPLVSLLGEADGPGGIVRFRDAIAVLVTDAGVPCPPFELHRRWVVAVVDELNRSRPTGIAAFEAVESVDDRALADIEEHQRERIRLHTTPLPLDIVDPSDLAGQAKDFARSHPEVGMHTLVVWLRMDLLRGQFIVPDHLAGVDGHVLGLLSCDRVHNEPVARFCWLRSAQPATLFQLLSSTERTLFLTSLATIVDTADDVDFGGVSSMFALVDQPVVGFVEHTVAAGAVLRWEPVWVDGDRELSVFVFANDQLPDTLFLHFATSAGRQVLARWLRQLSTTQVVHDPSLGEGNEHAGRLHAVVEHVIGTFWEIHQFGGRVRA